MKMLICHDGSEQADRAMRLGAAIAAGCAAEVTLFGIIEAPGSSETILESLKRGQALLEDRKIHAELITKSGEAIPEIVRRTEEAPYDLIVIGAARKEARGRFWMSSKTYKIIKEVGPPVLAVAGDSPTLKRILVSSGGNLYRETAMRLIAQIALAMGAGVTLFHVMPDVPGMYFGLGRMEETVTWLLDSPSELGVNLRREMELLQSLGVPAEVRLGHGSVLSEMLRELHEGSHDMVVSGSALSRGLRTYVLGDVTREIVNRADCAVLVVRGPRREADARRGLRGFLGRDLWTGI